VEDIVGLIGWAPLEAEVVEVRERELRDGRVERFDVHHRGGVQARQGTSGELTAPMPALADIIYTYPEVQLHVRQMSLPVVAGGKRV
jgi:hypothetical protein